MVRAVLPSGLKAPNFTPPLCERGAPIGFPVAASQSRASWEIAFCQPGLSVKMVLPPGLKTATVIGREAEPRGRGRPRGFPVAVSQSWAFPSPLAVNTVLPLAVMDAAQHG